MKSCCSQRHSMLTIAFLVTHTLRAHSEMATTTTKHPSLPLIAIGTIALSGNLIEALDALFMARIPAAWLKTSWEAATLGGWFAGLLQVRPAVVVSSGTWRGLEGKGGHALPVACAVVGICAC